MLRLSFDDEDSNALDKQIDAVLKEMSEKGVQSDEYPKLMTYLERLNKLKKANKRQPVSLDQVVATGGSFLIACLIVVYENKHVMTSKALTFVKPGKI